AGQRERERCSARAGELTLLCRCLPGAPGGVRPAGAGPRGGAATAGATGPAGARARRRGGPLPADQVTVPPRPRLRSDGEAPPVRARQLAAQRGQAEAVRGPPGRPLYLPPEYAHLVPEGEHLHSVRSLRLWTDGEQQVEQSADHGVHGGEE